MTRSAIAVLTVLLVAVPSLAQTTFSYQGELKDGGTLANGSFAMDFSLWDALGGGGQVGSTVSIPAVSVTDGRFTVELDFGAAAFDNSDRWLQVDVDSTPLSPRQPITRAPYSIQTRGLFVDGSEKIGLGTTSPIAQLHIDGVGTSVEGLRVDAPGTSSGAVTISSPTGRTGIIGIDGVNGHRRDIRFAEMGMALYSSPSSAAPSLGNGIFIHESGNVGIGTIEPESPLHAETDTEEWAVLGYAKGSSQMGVYGLSENSAGIGVYGFATSASGVNYGVYGRTLSEAGYGVYGLNATSLGVGVYGEAGGVGVFGKTQDGTGVAGVSFGGIAVNASDGADTGVNYGVHAGVSSTSGYDFYAYGLGIDYGSSSSIRWKRNVERIDRPLYKLSMLRGVYFDWDEEHGGHRDIGFIAEEVGAVLPEIVGYEENGIDAVGMDYSKLTPLLVESVKALKSENDELRLRLAMLEEQMARVLAQPSAHD